MTHIHEDGIRACVLVYDYDFEMLPENGATVFLSELKMQKLALSPHHGLR